MLVAQSWPTLCHPTGWAHQVSLSMGFSRQEYYSGLPFSSRGSSRPRHWTCHSCISGEFFTIWATMETQVALRDWSEEVREGPPLFFFFFNKDQVVRTSEDYHSIKKARLLKLVDVGLLCVGEDARAWAYWNHSFGMNRSHLGAASIPFHSEFLTGEPLKRLPWLRA